MLTRTESFCGQRLFEVAGDPGPVGIGRPRLDDRGLGDNRLDHNRRHVRFRSPVCRRGCTAGLT